MRALSLSLVFLLVAAGSAWSAPLDTSHVPADAKWVIHFDLDAHRASNVAQALSDDLFKERWAGARLKLMEKELGVDASVDLHSVTLFDTRFQRHHGLMLIRCANLDRERVVATLKQRHEKVGETDYRGHAIYTWLRGAGKRYEHDVSGCFHGSDALLISRDLDVLKRTLEVLDGSSESMAADSPLAGTAAAGTIIDIRSKGLATHDLPFRSAVMRQSKRFAMRVGEQDGKMLLHVEVDAKSEEDAERLTAMANGFRALAMTKHGSDEAGKRIFDGLGIERAEASVEATWMLLPEDAKTMMGVMKKHRQQRHQKKGRSHGKRHSKDGSASRPGPRDGDSGRESQAKDSESDS